jgi:hypothetical protein
MGSLAFQSPDRFMELGGGMLGNQLILVIDFPGSIEELSDLHLGLGIGSSV